MHIAPSQMLEACESSPLKRHVVLPTATPRQIRNSAARGEIKGIMRLEKF